MVVGAFSGSGRALRGWIGVLLGWVRVVVTLSLAFCVLRKCYPVEVESSLMMVVVGWSWRMIEWWSRRNPNSEVSRTRFIL